MEPPDSDAFVSHWAVTPTVRVRAPGRVNLIGEHTDYSLLPVLPIAIEQALHVLAGPSEGPAVEVRSDAFDETRRFERDHPGQGEGWGRYVVGVIRELESVAPGRGARLVVSGALPRTGGLSSSSALSCGVAAALLACWDEPADPDRVVGTAVAAERRTGVASGGMDQNVIVHGRAGHALRIDFRPPARRYVPIPAELAFVAAYSGEAALKADEARHAYNERVAGTRIAAAWMGDLLGFPADEVTSLAQVVGLDEAEFVVEALPESISPREAAKQLGFRVDHFSDLGHGSIPQGEKIRVRPYARHVLSEALRVDAAEASLVAGDLERFGALLNESHASLRDQFRCSTPALNQLTKAMRTAGALGARLTGAGFGGYALAACRPDLVAAVMAAAEAATGGPAFEVHAADGLSVTPA